MVLSEQSFSSVQPYSASLSSFRYTSKCDCVLNKTLKSLNWAKDSSCFLTMPEYCICGGPACVGLARTIDPRRPLSGGKRSCACACVCVCVRVVLPASHTHNHSTQTIKLANTITPWNVIERRSAGISGHKV